MKFNNHEEEEGLSSLLKDDNDGNDGTEKKVNNKRLAFFSHSGFFNNYSDNSKRHLREEALSELKFKPGIFFRTILYEMFLMPISTLLCILLENKHSSKNRHIGATKLPCCGKYWFLGTFYYFGYIGMVLGFVYVSDDSATAIYTSLTLVILLVSRAVTLGAKYGFYGNLDIYGEHGLMSFSYTYSMRINQKLLSIFFFFGSIILTIIAHVEEIYATSLRLDIDLSQIEVKVGNKEIAQAIVDEVRTIRKMMHGYQQYVNMQISKHKTKLKKKSTSTITTVVSNDDNKNNIISSSKTDDDENKTLLIKKNQEKNDDNSNNAGTKPYVAEVKKATITSKSKSSDIKNNGKINDHEENTKKKQMYFIINKYAESIEKDLFYRLGMDVNNDVKVQEQIDRGCVPTSFLAIVIVRRAFNQGNLWNKEMYGGLFITFLVNLIPIFVRVGLGQEIFGSSSPYGIIIYILHFMFFLLIYWLIFYYAHAPILAAVGRLKLKKHVANLISSDGIPFQVKINDNNGKNNGDGGEGSITATKHCMLDLSIERNIIAWNALRHLCHHYGASMRKKLNIYAIISLITVLTITAIPIVGTYIFRQGAMPVAEHVGNVVRLLLIGFSLMGSTLMAYIVDYYDNHIRDVVVRHKQAVQSYMTDIDVESVLEEGIYPNLQQRKLERCNVLLTDAVKQIGVTHKSNPEKMMLLRADPSICSFIITCLSIVLYFDILRLQRSIEGMTNS